MERIIALVSVIILVLTGGAVSASAQTDQTTVAEELAQSGYYSDFPLGSEDQAAIANANANGIAFAWLDDPAGGDEARSLAVVFLDHLTSEQLAGPTGSFHTVLVLTNGGVGAESLTGSASNVLNSLDSSIPFFVNDDQAGGIDAFTTTLTGGSTASAPSTDTPSTSIPSTDTSSGGSGGIGLSSILIPLALAGGAFWMFRNWRRSTQERKRQEADMAEDRAEIQEQLRDNADRVMSLGDQVITHGDPELIRLYEQASAGYQEVSRGIETADDPDEIDALDDQIDEAEYQFEVIEARLEGRPPPPSPAEREAEEARAEQERQAAEAKETAERNRPVLDRDESIFDQSSAPRPRRPRSNHPGGYTQIPRRRGGFGSGGLGGGLGGVLGSIVLGQTGGMGRRSRRTQRRTGGGGFGGGLGGGVLRPGGSRPSSSGGGRSFGRRSGGGRSF